MQKQYLLDIVLLRLILIILLVAFHSFAPYVGGWPSISDDKYVIYELLGEICYSAMLPCFVFISGVIMGHQTYFKGKIMSKFLIKKFKRLIIPSIIFSILYWVILIDKPIFQINFLFSILSSVGHLWFLPMLFWCFIGIYIINFFDKDEYIKIIIVALLLIRIFSIIPLPFRMGNTLYYLFFFYVGFLLGRKKLRIIKNCKCRYMIMGWIVFFTVYWLLRESIDVRIALYNDNIFLKALVLSMVNLLKISYSLFGTLALYLCSNYLIKNNLIGVSEKMVTFSSYCFGVYIFQEFILRLLYYRSNFIFTLPSIAVPWIAFLSTLALSSVFTYISLKTRIGRFLIG